MKSVFDTLQAISKDSSKINKMALLSAQKNNDDLRAFLKMTYEPRVNFYIKALDPKLTKMKALERRPFDQDLIAEIYDTLACRELTGNKVKVWLSDLYHSMEHDWEKDLLTFLIQRDVRAGFNVSSINKVWPGLVTQVPYMRCTLPKDANLASWPWAAGVYSQIKADGQFANVSHHAATGTVSIESRNGSPYPLEYFGAVIAEVKKHVPAGMQCHGELLIKRGGKIMERAKGNGIFNSLLQGGEPEAGDEIIYQAWDMIPLTEAKIKNKYNVPYKQRFAALIEVLKGLEAGSPISLIEYEIVHSYREAMDHARRAMLRGLEGTIVKHPEGIWEDSDSGSKNVVKLKLEFAVELKIVGMNPGDPKSKHAKTFGSLQMESADGKLKVGIPGFTDAMRAEIFNLFESYYKGKIATVVANDITLPDAEHGGFFSLFLPRWSDLRLDKTSANTLEEIIKAKENAIDQL